MRITLTLVLAGVVASGFSCASALAQQKGGEDVTGPYDVVVNFPQPIAQKGYVWGSQAGVFAETPNRIFLASRGELLLPAIMPVPRQNSVRL